MVQETDIEEAAERSADLPEADEVYDPDESIPLTDLFDGDFVRERTRFESLDEMVAASPSDAETADDLGTVRHGEWDDFVSEATDFADEEELVMAARDDWVAKKLDLT
jgi:hypothetical protein